MILDDEKQLIKIIKRERFIIEKSLWFIYELIILDLAIIINAEIRILNRIRVLAKVSKDDIDDMEQFSC